MDDFETNSSTSNKEATTIRHDWYQTECNVVILVLLKNVKQEDLDISFLEKKAELTLKTPDGDDIKKIFNLAHEINSSESSYKVTPSKIEIKLKKLEGIRWDSLEEKPNSSGPKSVLQGPSTVTSGPPSYPTSKKGKDWAAVEKEIKEEEAKEKPEGEEALNKLFKEIYGKGNDEVKRAMNKSYMESGGTVLSTNWNEISQNKVEVKPPDGMEWKKW